ncbi:MAG: neutral/alkaline non-lysosomal ceramidase N-terminal domain-containing protein [Armatimonadota bacterium]|nr:MAG: neutral/alkaline non-lysosomal ceramidase N-terminal domain-containing protein [Armatimonadota bacterium]
MGKFMRVLFWVVLLVLVLTAIAAGAFWIWFFSPRTETTLAARYGPFREAWRAGRLEQVAAGPLTAGAASVDITPPIGTPLGGYGARRGRPSTGVHDAIYAKALVLDNGSERIGIVTCDLIGVSKDVKRQVLKRAARATGLDDDHLLICASHTHSGPGALAPEFVWQLAMGRYDAGLRRQIVNKIAGALISANGNRRPARIGWAAGTAPEFASNRRGEDAERVTDPQLVVVRVDGQDDKPIAALVNFAAHGTCLDDDNMLVSGDWPGYLQRRLEAEIGDGVTAMFANGAQGDQSPRSPNGLDGYRGAEDVGFGLADRCIEMWTKIRTQDEAELAVASFPVRLPEGLGSVLLTPATRITAMNLAGLGIMAVPGEMSAPLGMRLKEQARRLGFAEPCIFGLANDHIGYILTEDQYRRGGYERTVSGYGPGLGQFIEKAFAGAVMELAVRASDITPVVEDKLGRRICGPARAYHKHGQWILELTGNPYEIGYRHGALVKPEFKETLAAMRKSAGRELPVPGGMRSLLFAARRSEYMLERHLPPEYVLEIHGLADGLGLDYDTTLFLQVMLAIVEQPTMKKMLGVGASCSNMVAIGSATRRAGDLIHGRNLDWGMGEVLPQVATVAFYKPAAGHDFVAVNWAGMVGCLTAMNAAGLCIGEESVSSPLDTSVDGKPLFLLIREAIQYCDSLDQAVDFVAETPGTCGYHVTICDGNLRDARTVEVTAHHHAVRVPRDDVLFGCVGERRPEMFEGGALPHPDIARADSSSDSRYARLRELAAEYHGRIDVPRMAEFLRDDIDPRSGKPGSSGHSVCNSSTLHSVVMRPGRRDLWVAQGEMPAPTGEYVHYELRQVLARMK